MPYSPDYIPGRVSVIIISFNYGNYIVDAIQSALAQNIDDMEIIMVDDGSTDGTRDIVNPYSSQIKYIFQKNAGQSAARNTGLENSTGEFIQFLDSDDILGPSKIATQLDYFRSHPDVSITVCPTRRFRKLSRNRKPIIKGSWYLFHKNLDLYLCFFNIAPPHAFLYRRLVFTQTGMFDSAVDNCEDYDFLLRTAVKGYIPKVTPFCQVYYRQHKKSVTANALRQYLTDVKMHKRLADLLDQHTAFPTGYRLEGLLAYSAGAIKTAERLNSIYPATSHILIQWADERMSKAIEIAREQKSSWNYPMQLFCLKILISLSLDCFKKNRLIEQIRINLTEILQFYNAPMAPMGLIFDSLFFIFRKSKSDLHARYILVYHSLIYLINLMFPYASRLKWPTRY